MVGLKKCCNNKKVELFSVFFFFWVLILIYKIENLLFPNEQSINTTWVQRERSDRYPSGARVLTIVIDPAPVLKNK